jgi:phenylpropionate dioxygenase-like ring-hydroxylating dioxygenase large terminal subunit
MKAAPNYERLDVPWPTEGYRRAPYRLLHDPEVYRLEQERIFRGPVWTYVGLDAELKESGDFKTTFIGDAPVVIVRNEVGGFNGFVNRCAHRGSLVCTEPFGSGAKRFVCPYHAWVYDLQGDLKSVAFQHGMQGQGGLPTSFDFANHGLEKLRVDTFARLIFATFSKDAPSLHDYIGETVGPGIQRVLKRPIRILGYDSQIVNANWKIFGENIRDTYHGNILHTYFATFGISRYSQKNGAVMDPRGSHLYFYQQRDLETETEDYRNTAKHLQSIKSDFKLRDTRILSWFDEFGDGNTNYITSLFPPLMVQQIMHSLAIQQLIPRGHDRCEMLYTYFGFEDDSPEMTELRLIQSNLMGAAGLVAMEDGAVCEFVQRGTQGSMAHASSLEMGGVDLSSGGDTKISDRPMRNFWHVYRSLMEL